MIRLQLKGPRSNFGLAKIARQNPRLFHRTGPGGSERDNFPQREFPYRVSPLGAQIFKLHRLVQTSHLQRRLHDVSAAVPSGYAPCAPVPTQIGSRLAAQRPAILQRPSKGVRKSENILDSCRLPFDANTTSFRIKIMNERKIGGSPNHASARNIAGRGPNLCGRRNSFASGNVYAEGLDDQFLFLRSACNSRPLTSPIDSWNSPATVGTLDIKHGH